MNRFQVFRQRRIVEGGEANMTTKERAAVLNRWLLDSTESSDFDLIEIERAFAEAVAEEREACAKIAESMGQPGVALAIRRRGEA